MHTRHPSTQFHMLNTLISTSDVTVPRIQTFDSVITSSRLSLKRPLRILNRFRFTNLIIEPITSIFLKIKNSRKYIYLIKKFNDSINDPLITFETFVHPGTEWLGIEFNIVALRKFSTSLHKFPQIWGRASRIFKRDPPPFYRRGEGGRIYQLRNSRVDDTNSWRLHDTWCMCTVCEWLTRTWIGCSNLVYEKSIEAGSSCCWQQAV